MPPQAQTPLSEPTFYILLSLAPGPSHGYAMIKDIEQLSGGRVSLSTGTLYGAIKRLLELGWIRRLNEPSPSDTTRTPRRYELTDLGRQALVAEAAHLEQLHRLARERLALG